MTEQTNTAEAIARIRAALTAGTSLANCAFNLAQNDGLTASWRATLDKVRRDFDEVNARADDAIRTLLSKLEAAEARVVVLRDGLEAIRQYGSDTLSGRTDGPDDRAWQREAVHEMTRRARAALATTKEV